MNQEKGQVKFDSTAAILGALVGALLQLSFKSEPRLAWVYKAYWGITAAGFSGAACSAILAGWFCHRILKKTKHAAGSAEAAAFLVGLISLQWAVSTPIRWWMYITASLFYLWVGFVTGIQYTNQANKDDE